jgi:hypothetical protein
MNMKPLRGLPFGVRLNARLGFINERCDGFRPAACHELLIAVVVRIPPPLPTRSEDSSATWRRASRTDSPCHFSLSFLTEDSVSHVRLWTTNAR